MRQRTQKRNALRAHLSERGLTSRRGKSALYALIESVIRPDEDGVIGTGSEIDGLFVSILAKEYQTLRNLDQEVEDYDSRIKALVNGSEPMRRVMEIPGFGPITASSFVAALGDGQAFKCGRVVSAWLGLVPRQPQHRWQNRFCSASPSAATVICAPCWFTVRVQYCGRLRRRIKKILSAVGRWKLRKRRGRHKATLAIANKMARVGWVVLAKDVHYDSRLVV